MIRAKLSIGIVIAASLLGSTPVMAGLASKLKVSTATQNGDAGGANLCIVRDGKKGRWFQDAGKWYKCKLSGGEWNAVKGGGGFGGAAPVVAGVAGAGGGLAALAGGGDDEETPASQ